MSILSAMETLTDIQRPACPVVRLEIEPHPDADRLELAKVGGFRAVVGKGQFQTGDLAVYIPEGSIVPDYLLERLGLVGKLAGKDKNRVKAIRLRGVLSQGLVVPVEFDEDMEAAYVEADTPAIFDYVTLGEDAAELLDVQKYVPPVPVSMSGDVWPAGLERTLSYDIENIKAWPYVIEEGEQVVFTEKIHGTFCGIGLLPERLADSTHGDVVVFSKGLGGKGLVFDLSAEHPNIYVRALLDNRVAQRIRDNMELSCYVKIDQQPVFVLGEVFGAGVQDLAYGANSRAAGQLGFCVFDIYVGQRGQGRFLHSHVLDLICTEAGFERVPVLYRGPFSPEVLTEYTSGTETVSGEGQHLREGVVVRPAIERRHDALGRVQLKSVSEDYLLRKGGTELQ